MAPSVRVVEYPVSKWVEVPRTLTNPHPLPTFPDPMTNADMERGLQQCMLELEQANSDKARIRALPRSDE